MDKDEVIRYLYARHSTGMKLGLKHIRDLLLDLGNPQDLFKSIHIAGTNGKGSCAAMLESILRAAGYRTGLYTSPHLIRPEERIRISGKDIAEEAFLDLVWGLKDLAEKQDASFFEILTAAGFLHFADEKVDIAVVETGLGGRLDATNTMMPVLSMITEIGLDHTQILGDEIQTIAMEKAGILKAGVPFICSAKNPHVRKFFRQYASAHQVPMISSAEVVKIRRIRMTEDGTILNARMNDRRLDDLFLRLAGRHQVDNCAGVLAATCVLRDSGWDIPDSAIRTGLAKVRWPGRLDLVQKNPGLLLDSAHNPPGMKKLAEALQSLFKYDRLILLLGVLSDKDYRKMAGLIAQQAQHIILARPLTE
ncbi:bifunctional folylpolyglutamate synthase/dihydrofolate synthase, partial [bacterium]|nr:bifunctional folylpolyglutamate synthase/dihydrofolate synthase [bacterium]